MVVQDLFLGSNSLGNKGVAALAPSLPALLGLQLLDLSANGISDAGATALAPALAHLQALCCLDMSANDLTALGGGITTRALTSAIFLRCLCLDLNPLGAVHMQSLSGALASLPGIRDLDLSRVDMGDQGACELAAGLTALSSLVRLDLESNALSGKGFTSLGAAFGALPALAHLVLSSNRLSGMGAAALAAVLPQCVCLECLELAYCGCGYKEAVVLGPGLAGTPALQRLCLSGNPFGDAGTTVLGLCLGDCDQLTEIEMVNCGVRHCSADSLAAVAATLSYPPSKFVRPQCSSVLCDEDALVSGGSDFHMDVFSQASTGDGGSSCEGLIRHRSATLGKAVHLQSLEVFESDNDSAPLRHRRASDAGVLLSY